MKLTVEFPNVVYREGPEGVLKLARAIEEIGYDQLDMFDHVIMGYPTSEREGPRYSPRMPIIEALMTLSFVAAATKEIGLGTEVLVLPQRQPTLVAKQVQTLDTLSGGRVRLGVGVGWQESEYEALGESFTTRGARMDEAIRTLRSWWGDDPVTLPGPYYPAEAMAMEPKSPQGGELPIWVGGLSPRALRRAGELGDGWMAVGFEELFEKGEEMIATVKAAAEAAGRDPSALEFQSQISPPPREGSDDDRNFYAEPERVAEVAVKLQDLGFGWAAINVTGVFLAGARSVEAMSDALADLHDVLRRRVG